MPTLAVTSDAELVAATLAGDRRAFGQIVERYQRLLCSLAYSATGQLSQSEDLAQEAFVAAWSQLASLREPEKLRPWLCGILRFKISRLRRADGREPVRQADPLDAAEAIPSPDAPAPERAVQKEEQAILWSALARVPATYREPLILYYREGRSVEHVAASLDLNEDAVKQRLARGRKILHEQVLAFVEGALARSSPGRVFTLGVLALLPELTRPAKAVGLGTAAAQGAALAKSTGLAALLASVSSLIGPILTLRTNLDQSRTPHERRLVAKVTCGFILGAFGFIGALWLLRQGAWRWWEARGWFAGLAQAIVGVFLVAWPLAVFRTMRCARRLRSSERRERPEYFTDPRHQPGSAASEYRSRWRLFGVPLVHIRFSLADEGQPPVFGWFAGGDRAYALIFAWGAYAVAPISVGAVGIGLLTIGNFSLGVISLGTVGVGLVAIGSAAVGVQAFAWLSAAGWHTAQANGFALARVAAEGPLAFASHANDAVARQLLANPHAEQHHMIMLSIIAIVSVVPIACYAAAVRHRLGAAKKR